MLFPSGVVKQQSADTTHTTMPTAVHRQHQERWQNYHRPVLDEKASYRLSEKSRDACAKDQSKRLHGLLLLPKEASNTDIGIHRHVSAVRYDRPAPARVPGPVDEDFSEARSGTLWHSTAEHGAAGHRGNHKVVVNGGALSAAKTSVTTTAGKAYLR